MMIIVQLWLTIRDMGTLWCDCKKHLFFFLSPWLPRGGFLLITFASFVYLAWNLEWRYTQKICMLGNFFKFFKISLLFLTCPWSGVYLGHLRGFSPIFDPKKSKFEAIDWTCWRFTNITRFDNEFYENSNMYVAHIGSKWPSFVQRLWRGKKCPRGILYCNVSAILSSKMKFF